LIDGVQLLFPARLAVAQVLVRVERLRDRPTAGTDFDERQPTVLGQARHRHPEDDPAEQHSQDDGQGEKAAVSHRDPLDNDSGIELIL
jgi:hypothetical protein